MSGLAGHAGGGRRRAVLIAPIVAIAIAAAVIGTVRIASRGASAASPSAAACRSTLPAGASTRLSVDGDRVPVVVHMPRGGTGGHRLPVIIVLPGAGQTASAIASYTGYSRLADRKRFIVVYPTATGSRPFWNVSGSVPGKPDDVAYLRRVIVAVTSSSICGDAARVGMTGVSNGGGMTARMACEAGDLLSAAAPVAGGYSTLPACEPRRPLPILEIHGLRDTVVPYHGKGPQRAGSVDSFLAEWRERDHCPARPTRVSRPSPNTLEKRWNCAHGTVLDHDRIADAEHGWPGEASLAATGTTVRTWRFLSAFRR